jgi:ADP-ribose pyrophosphatase YjhB (NUDIX family)
MDMNYCRRCGRELNRQDDGFVCANGHTIYANPAPTVGVFFLNDFGQVMLAVRGIEPNKGTLDTPGGFVETGESSEQAMQREITEELGLQQKDYSPLEYLTSAVSTYEYGGETFDVLSSFYVSKLSATATPQPADDVSDITWIHPDDINLQAIGNTDVKTAVHTLRKHLAGR